MDPIPASSGCRACRDAEPLGFDFTMAFQPIVDTAEGRVFAHEALVRGLDGGGAGPLLARVNDSNRYQFDQRCRVKAIELAARLDMQSALSINFMPNAVYRPELCIRTTLEAAERCNFPVSNIIFEFTEAERVMDHGFLRSIIEDYRRRGFRTAIDDFGAGYSGLNLLADFQTDYLKIDMALIRDLHLSHSRQVIVESIVEMCRRLGIQVIAEGVETQDELRRLQAMGIDLFQGYLIARPAFEALPVPQVLGIGPPPGVPAVGERRLNG